MSAFWVFCTRFLLVAGHVESAGCGFRVERFGLHCSAMLGKSGLGFKLEGFGLARLRQSFGC